MDHRRLSKKMSYVLRHNPESAGLLLDAAGWTDLSELAEGLQIDEESIRAVVAGNDKQRFALSEDGARIRANQGHSIAVDLGYKQTVPPIILFHGTVDSVVASIRAKGLIRGQRHHVHLSADRATAMKVGARRGRAVVLEVRAAAMSESGHTFFVTPNGVWLVEHVPAEFIRP